jgi:ATP-binding cassette subfamily F protein 3
VYEFFSQYQHDELHPESTVLASVLERAPLDVSAKARDLLGAFLFSGDDVYKKVKVLSGGEKTRLRLARMLYSKSNLLLMDEPTNHLDVASRATLERALMQYTGTLIFVSHDRVFMDRLANKILEIHDGQIRHYPGNFTDYLRAKQREIAEGIIENAPFMIQDGKVLFSGSISYSQKSRTQTKSQRKKSKEEKRREAQRRNELGRKKKPLEKEVKFLEKAIRQAEGRLSEIEQLLQQPEVYTDAARCTELIRERKSLERQLESDLRFWEKKSKELEKILKEYSP